MQTVFLKGVFVDEVLKMMNMSGLPVWAQFLGIIILAIVQYFIIIKKNELSISKEKKSLREKHLLMHSAAETFFNEKYHIKKKVFIDQRSAASRILQNFTNDLYSVYEERL